MENQKLRKKIRKISSSNEIKEEIIEEELKKKQPTTEQLKEKIQEAAEKPAKTNTALGKRMKRVSNSVKIKRKQVVDIQEEEFFKLLDENKDLKEELSQERRIQMILDNYPAHYANLVKKVAKFLNIKLIFIPTHSPKLNPIEQVWRAMKKKISSIDFKCIIELTKKIKFYYFKYVKDKSFTKNWMKKFISKS
jgi:transposase